MPATTVLDKLRKRRRVARTLVVAAALGTVVAGAACEPDHPPINPDILQKIDDIGTQAYGTQVRVTFHTNRATDKAKVELWTDGKLVTTKSDPTGTPLHNHNILISYLQPETSYTVKVLAPQIGNSGSWVSSTAASPARTLIRKVTVTARWAHVANDSDENACGEAAMELALQKASSTLTYGWGSDDWHDICSGYAWDPGDKSVTMDHMKDPGSSFHLRVTEDDDNVVCVCREHAEGVGYLDFTAESSGFTKDVAVEVYPKYGANLRMTWYLRYTVSYHY